VLKRLLTAAVGVFGLVVIGLGIASATVWRADDVLVAESGGQARTLVTDPGVLELGGDPVTITVRVPDKSRVVLAIGRDTDVEGWVGTDAHDRVTGLSSWHQLALEGVEAPAPTASPTASDAAVPAVDPATTEAAGAAPSDAPAVADPSGNDMWVAESEGDGSATLVWHAPPGRWSLLAVSPESAAAPTLSLAWPRVVTTPWLWPCVVVGGLLVLLSLGLMLRGWLRRRAGIVGPQWRDVTTGPTPAVEPARTDQPAMTRRQLREAAAAGSSRLTGPSAPHNPAGDRGSEMPAPVGTAPSPRASVPATSQAAEGPGLTAVTSASSRRALRTGSVPVVAAGSPADRPLDAESARPAGTADQGRTPGTPAGSPPGATPVPWASSASAPGGSSGSAAPTTAGRTTGWTPSAPPAPGSGAGARPTLGAPHVGAVAQSGTARPAPADAGRPGHHVGDPSEHAAHGRPAWATGPIPVTRPGSPSAGPALPPPGAVVGAPGGGGPGRATPVGGASVTGAAGSGAPVHGAPGYGAPGHGAPGHGAPGHGAPGSAAGRPPAWSAGPPPPGARSTPGAEGGPSGPDASRSHAAHRPTWLHEPAPQGPAGQGSTGQGTAHGPGGDEVGDQAGSRGDAWRRAWGLPPLEPDTHQDTTREEGR
jgi:hypothetical protein